MQTVISFGSKCTAGGVVHLHRNRVTYDTGIAEVCLRENVWLKLFINKFKIQLAACQYYALNIRV